MDRVYLLDSLWAIQEKQRYISKDDIADLARQYNLSKTEVEGVASFYHFFHDKHAGKYTIYLNTSIVSKQSGYHRVRTALEESTGAKWGETSPMGTFGLFDTSCIGLSDQEPAALINLYPFTNLSPSKVRKIINALKKGVPVEDIYDKVEDKIRYTPSPERTIFFRPFKPGLALKRLMDIHPAEVIQEIKDAGLSGRGGAFFSTGIKWEACSKNPGPRYIACNADEGEPGFFKDRVLLTQLPGLIIEGMITAGYAVGAEEGIIYLRAEYKWLLPKLADTIEEYRNKGWLGNQIEAKVPFKFDIRVQLGAGAYVCGEENAMLRSMEGRRGEPGVRQYFPTERGFLGQPTVVNNVETLCAAARVIQLGVDYFNSIGTKASKGTKLISISGDCGKPGIYEIEWGMTLGRLLMLCEAEDPYFIQVSGPAGQTVSWEELNRKICRDDLGCAGGLMVFNRSRDILRILRNFNDFFRKESCGMCTPCRAGNFIVGRRLEKIHLGQGGLQDFEELRSWGNMIKKTSRCGLGQTAPNSFLQALEKFPDYFQNLIVHQDELKGFDLEKAVADYQFAVKQNEDYEG